MDPLHGPSSLVGNEAPQAELGVRAAPSFDDYVGTLALLVDDVAVQSVEACADDIQRLWNEGQRVPAFRAAVDLAGTLTRHTTSASYPGRALRIADVLRRFSRRLRAHLSSGSSKVETCRRWLALTGAIYGVVARVYMETALLDCHLVVEAGAAGVEARQRALRRLARSCRGIADPVAASYARLFVVRQLGDADDVSIVGECAHDQIRGMYPRCDAATVALIGPSLTWQLMVARDLHPAVFPGLLDAYRAYSNDAALLQTMLDLTNADVLLDNAEAVLAVILEVHPVNAGHLKTLIDAVARASTAPVTPALFTALRRATMRMSSDASILEACACLASIAVTNVSPLTPTLLVQLQADVVDAARRCRRKRPDTTTALLCNVLESFLDGYLGDDLLQHLDYYAGIVEFLDADRQAQYWTRILQGQPDRAACVRLADRLSGGGSPALLASVVESMPASVDVDDLQGQLQVVQEVASRAPDLGALLTRRALNLAVAAHRLVAATKGSSAFTSDCLRFAASGLSDGSAAMDYQAVIEVATATGHLDQAEATTRRAFQRIGSWSAGDTRRVVGVLHELARRTQDVTLHEALGRLGIANAALIVSVVALFDGEPRDDAVRAAEQIWRHAVWAPGQRDALLADVRRRSAAWCHRLQGWRRDDNDT
ncbi:unnamed protein product (mitochondrion) [Plasmodiophora brassicae]|uniref:Uncharacterized protein n=1 Tax=Plasmodiophora brassicae TaxID=37360 RepID=A0A3P3YLY7_PLABS|nr:unnamed protein product [Plasmodiophora brassicae]